jgi:hypothetical protein
LGTSAGYVYRDRQAVGNAIATATQETHRIETESIQRDALHEQSIKFLQREVYFSRLDIRAGGVSPFAAPPASQPTSQP